MNGELDQSATTPMAGQRVVVTGASGQLGKYLLRTLVNVGATSIGLAHKPGEGIKAVDITDTERLASAVANAKPHVIIHAAAMTDVDECEREPDLANRINHIGARNVAQAAIRSNAYLIAVSTDFVFSGAHPPYAEHAHTDPISVYGASKRAGEVAVLDASDMFAVVRTAWLYGGKGKHFPRTILNLLAARPSIDVVDDERGNPTFAGDLADALVRAVSLRLSGIVHLTNAGTASRFQLARQVASLASLSPDRVQPTTAKEFLQKYPLPACRPADSSLRNERAAAYGVTMRPWTEALAWYMPQLVDELSPRQS